MESACCRAMSGVGSALQTPTVTKNVLLAGPTETCPGKWTWLSQAKRNTANAVLESDQPAVGTSNLVFLMATPKGFDMNWRAWW
jgi:hypothetical protein